MLPLCGGKVEDFKYLKGCFIADDTHREISEKIFLLYNDEYSLFQYQDEWLQQLNLFNDKYQVADHFYMYVMNLPIGYESNYHKFINGKYSLFDEEYKRHILKFQSTYNDIDLVKKILHRSERLYRDWEEHLDVIIPRDQEIGSIPDMEKETFNLKMIDIERKEWI